MIAIRLVKTGMVASCGLLALLVALGNVTDYNSNYQFVRHTLSMDTTFPDNALKWRAITSPLAWTAAYWLIIGTEAATGLLLGLGAIRMLAALRAPAAVFNAAKQTAMLGIGLGFALWFTGFMAIAGEWFMMWQSANWNGQAAAFRFYMTMMAVGIFVLLPDQDG